MKLLHLDSSILGGNSASRQLSAAVVDQLTKKTPGLDIVYRDLAAEPLSHLVGRTTRRPPGRGAGIAGNPEGRRCKPGCPG